jgi:hypothetical protein
MPRAKLAEVAPIAASSPIAGQPEPAESGDSILADSGPAFDAYPGGIATVRPATTRHSVRVMVQA